MVIPRGFLCLFSRVFWGLRTCLVIFFVVDGAKSQAFATLEQSEVLDKHSSQRASSKLLGETKAASSIRGEVHESISFNINEADFLC